MQFKDPIDEERLRHFRRGQSFTNTDAISRPDAVIRSKPKLAVSPVNSRIYGVFVDDDGILKSGIVLSDDSDWESTQSVALVPSAHTGKIKNPCITVDSLGNLCIGYEYWSDSITSEVWVYDERLVGSSVVPYLQKVIEGSCPATISDRDNDLLIFYKKVDGTLCWRARSAPPYTTVWDTENTISITGLAGDIYLDDVFIVGGTETYESVHIVMCISKRGPDGRYALYYVRSRNWPKSITDTEFLLTSTEISAISWIIIVEYVIEEGLLSDAYIQMINWISVSEYETADTLLALSEISTITWSGGVEYTISETLLSSGEISGITWTSNNNVNSPDEEMACSSQITVLSLTSI